MGLIEIAGSAGPLITLFAPQNAEEALIATLYAPTMGPGGVLVARAQLNGPYIAEVLRKLNDPETRQIYVSDDFQGELAFLGIESSPAFVRAPEGNGCSERFIRTLKEQLLWVRTFETVEELRLALHEWLEVYNEQWLIERHSHRSPAQVRRDLLASSVAA
jgi:transposase InsO family protein